MALEFNLNFIQKSVRNPLQKLKYTKEIPIAIPSGILNIKATGFIQFDRLKVQLPKNLNATSKWFSAPLYDVILQNYECYVWCIHIMYYKKYYICNMYIKLGTAISHLFCLKMSTTELCATSQLPPTNWVSIAKYHCTQVHILL